MNAIVFPKLFLRISCMLLFRRAVVFSSSPKHTNLSKSSHLCLQRKSMDDFSGSSIHAAQITEVHDVPFEVLIRPYPSLLEEDKVLSLMETLKNPETRNDVPPIDVVWVTGKEGGDYYYSFGGCHRYEAHKRLGLPTIRCKLVKSTVQDLRTYLGGSTPDLL